MSLTYKKSSQTISVKWSASHMTNNLTIHRSSESRRSIMYGVSHKSGFAMVISNEREREREEGKRNLFRLRYLKMGQNKFKGKLFVELLEIIIHLHQKMMHDFLHMLFK